MEGAPHYRDRAARLRELAGVERDVIVRQQLIQLAMRFENFADELESNAASANASNA